MARQIAALVGSLRKESYTRKVLLALSELARPSLEIAIVEIGGLPLYNQDLDPSPPQEWVALRDRIRPADGVLFGTPEYNRSVPGVLKNAIDIASRPYGHSVFARKPAAVVSVTPGAYGAFGANHHLRQSLAYLDMPTLPQPELYVREVAKWFGPEGRLSDGEPREMLTGFATAFAAWIERWQAPHPAP